MAEEGTEDPPPRKPRKMKKKTEDQGAGDDVPKTSAKLQVDKILQQVVSQSAKNALDEKKKKKKRENNDPDPVLESLRKGEGIDGLHKPQDDAVLANIYDPDNNIKSEKSNKQRQKRQDKEKSNKEKTNVEEPVSTPGEKKKKKKIKKEEPLLETDMEKRSEDAEEEPKESVQKTESPKKKKKKSEKDQEEVENEIKEEIDETPVPEKAEKAKKKTKGKKGKKDDDEDREEKAEKEDDGTGDKPEEKEVEEEKKTFEKKKKKKKKEKKAGKSDPGSKEDAAEDTEIADIQDLGEAMALHIHRTDRLKNDFFILHPVVRVHLIDEETGQYLQKQHQDRAITSYYETSNVAVKTILPMMTKPFDFKERRSTLPVWEDTLVFNENFNYFIQPKPKVIVFFELLDFVSMGTARQQFSSQKEEGGWHRIAWAFLKLLGTNGKVNAGNKLRLQLFEPPSKSTKGPGQPEVYTWWKSGQRTPYPSTLYVTLKSIETPGEVTGGTRSMFATQKELGHMTYKDLKSMNWTGREKKNDSVKSLTTWTRLLGQLCRVPNLNILTLVAGKKGCYVVKFSRDGRNLACACQDGTDYPILVYEIPSGKLKGKFSGHFGIIYSLCWSRNDTQLMSASSDGTVRIWSSQKFGETQDHLLPHPGFVYAAEFHPRVDGIVVTGGYDEVLRVWDITIAEEGGMLQQEMEEHHGHINSICFDNDEGQKMYSADSKGKILIWNVFVTEQASRKHFVRDWTKFQAITDPELKDTSINYIQMHPCGRRLLVHARNNAIFMFDLRVQRVMQKYFGAENLKEKICSSITPCGSFVFSGSEDGKVYAWNTDTGDQVAVYNNLNYQHPVTDVHYHPRDHVLAMCSLGDNHPVTIYRYDPTVAKMDGLSPRPGSPIETTQIEDIEASHSGVLSEANLETVRSKVMNKDEFQTQEQARYQRIMKKLDTTTMQLSQMPGYVVPEALVSPRLDTIGRNGIQSTWKMQHNSSYSLSPQASTAMSTLSPHAPASSRSLLASQIAAQREYMKASDGWRPTFAEMGKQGSKSPNMNYFGRPLQLTLSTQSMGKPKFTFETPVGKSASQNLALVLYDYRAQRSDELTLYKGDLVRVLYKDNDNWWMGELEDGRQGFFPANYVTEDEEEKRQKWHTPASSSAGSVTAVKTKSGELVFLSGDELSEDETTAGKRKGEKGKGVNKPSAERKSSIDVLLGEYESLA